jgi:hypothetical protein
MKLLGSLRRRDAGSEEIARYVALVYESLRPEARIVLAGRESSVFAHEIGALSLPSGRLDARGEVVCALTDFGFVEPPGSERR